MTRIYSTKSKFRLIIENNWTKSDHAGLRLAGQKTDLCQRLDQIEKEMISLYPVNHLFTPIESSAQEQANLADIDFALKSR